MRIILSAAAAAALALTAGNLAAEAKTYRAASYEVAYAAAADGTVRVEETIRFEFAGGPFTYVFRELPTAPCDGIEFVGATLDGRPLPAGDGEGAYELRDRRGRRRVTVRFPATSDAPRTVGMTYVLHGAAAPGKGCDLFRWPALPDEYGYGIDRAVVRVAGPAGVRALGAEVVEGEGKATIADDGAARFEATGLEPNAPLVVEVRFPARAIMPAPPAWFAREEAGDRTAPYWIVGSAALFAVLFLLWRPSFVALRGEKVGSCGPVEAPPADLPAAEAAYLRYGGQAMTWQLAGATLLDLARRGAIAVRERPASRWTGKSFDLELVARPADLAPHETALLDAAFGADAPLGSRADKAALAARATAGLAAYGTALDADVERAGFVDPARRLLRRRALVRTGAAWAALTAVGGVVLALGVESYGGWAALPLLAALLWGVVAFLALLARGTLSDEGRRQEALWSAFARHMGAIARGKVSFERADLFEAWLPYAAAFGLTNQWSRFFAKRPGFAAPAWFGALADAGQDAAATFTTFVAIFVSTGGFGGGGGVGGGGAAGGAGGGASGAG